MNTKDHDCRKYVSSKTATVSQPFRFTWSGLPNVYITGIRYDECSECESVAGTFPQPAHLVQKLTELIVQKSSPLSGSEIKYLRKHLRKKSIDFAKLVGVSAEQVSRWENGHNHPERAADKLIRLLAADRSNRKQLEVVVGLTCSSPVEKGTYLLRFRDKKWSGIWRPNVYAPCGSVVSVATA